MKKIKPNVISHGDGTLVLEIEFPFPIDMVQFRDIEDAKNFFMKGELYILRHSDIHEAYLSAYIILAEAALYSAELKYLGQISQRLVMQLEFPNYSTQDKFFEEVQKL